MAEELTTVEYYYFDNPVYDELKVSESVALVNLIVVFIVVLFLFVMSAVLTGLMFYYYSIRPGKWIKVTRNMHQKLSKQVLLDENLKKLCELINTSVDTVRLDRKELCIDVELDADLPAARTVDPFKAPSNLYDQVGEKDDDYRTMKYIDNDVFLKKDDLGDLKVSKPQGTAPPPATGTTGTSTQPSTTTQNATGQQATGENIPPPTANTPINSTAPEGTTTENKAQETAEKPAEEKHSVQM